MIGKVRGGVTQDGLGADPQEGIAILCLFLTVSELRGDGERSVIVGIRCRGVLAFAALDLLHETVIGLLRLVLIREPVDLLRDGGDVLSAEAEDLRGDQIFGALALDRGVA